ncbi:MAG: class I SAM-dependent methyltransferase [Fibrobacteria bacterium]|nr:class I SAM-dependent methyltransferase [Fibrobacteria bacterium]
MSAFDGNHLEPSHFRELADLENWYWWHQVRFRWAWREIKKAGAGKVADIGCGTGGFLSFLRAKGGYSLTGFEDSEAARTILGEKGLSAVKWDLDSAAPIVYMRAFHAALLLDVLEHVDDDVASLKSVCSMVQPGGMILITVPSDPRLFSDWDIKLSHRRRYSREALRAVAEACGLTSVEIYHVFRWAWIPGMILRKGKQLDQFPRLWGILNKILLAYSEVELRLFGKISIVSGTSLFLKAIVQESMVRREK